MNMRKVVLAGIFLFFAISQSYADCLEDSLESFKQVANAVYEEMGRPEVNLKSMEKLQRQIFLRPSNKIPTFHAESAVSWIEHPDALLAVSTCAGNGGPVSQSVLWRPDEDLEYIDEDAVFRYKR